MIPEDTLQVTVALFALTKERTGVTWNVPAIPGQNESVVRWQKKCVDLILKTVTEIFTLAMLVRMRLACCVLPQGKALVLCLCVIQYEMYLSFNM